MSNPIPSPLELADALIAQIISSGLLKQVVLAAVSQPNVARALTANWTHSGPTDPKLSSAVDSALKSALKCSSSDFAGPLRGVYDNLASKIARNFTVSVKASLPPPVSIPVVGYSPEQRAAFRKKQHLAALQRKAARQARHERMVAAAAARKKRRHVSAQPAPAPPSANPSSRNRVDSRSCVPSTQRKQTPPPTSASSPAGQTNGQNASFPRHRNKIWPS